MPEYKLIYFNAKARGEVARQLMAYGDIEFEDVRLEKETWPEMKPKTPFGQCPVLEFDGHKLCQSSAIGRFLARKVGLMGNTEIEDAKIDMITGCIEDIFQKATPSFFEEDEARKAKLVAKCNEELPTMLANLEKLVEGDYFIGDKMTWADMEMANGLDMLCLFGAPFKWDDYPKMKAIKERVFNSPKIAAWIAKRPETNF